MRRRPPRTAIAPGAHRVPRTSAGLSEAHRSTMKELRLPSSRPMSLLRETFPTMTGVPTQEFLPVPASVGFLGLFSAESAARQGAGPGRPLLG